MKVISVNVGMPKEIVYDGRAIQTGIFKSAVTGRIPVTALNLKGDGQADLTVHGGPSKAIYAFPSEHYAFWRDELPEISFNYGMFGENLTTEGLLEHELNVGDRLCVGSAELMVTEPRLPCYKLNLKFGREDIVKRFLQSRRTGFYFAVHREGTIGAADQIEILSRDANGVTVADITRLYAFDRNDSAGMRRAAEVSALPSSWRSYFRDRIGKQAQ
jgi:MOSC domain-containing protein YiiM